MKLKLCYSFMLFMSTFLLVAQQEDFVSNTWYLEKLIIDGEDYFLPQNEEVNQSTLTIDSDNSVFYINFCYGGMAEGLSFPDENYFTIDVFVTPAMSCELQENSYYQNLYFDFISDNVQLPFYYEITEEANNLKKLVITDNNNNQAVYYNAPVPQITLIPDPNFEQELITQNIDSDGVVNGQILTSDVLAVTSLTLYDVGGITGQYIYDLTGLEDFINLESLTVGITMVEELNLSTLVNLKYLDCVDNMLTSIDVSNNPLLEYIDISSGGDVLPMNGIAEIDLSNNPNIHTVKATGIKSINLRSGNNNENMFIIAGCVCWDYPVDYIDGNVCIEVDNVDLAQNNQYPYSEWTISHSNMTYSFTDDVVACSLNTPSFEKNKISIYPNPVADILYFDTTGPVDKIMIFDMSGRTVLEENYLNSVSVSHLQKGSYILKIFTDRVVQTEKILVK